MGIERCSSSRSSMGNLGELDIISRVSSWQYFGTGTFVGLEPSTATAQRLLFAHLYRCADALRIPFHRLLWAIRQERGEIGDRLHYHWLLGGSHKTPSKGLCFYMMDLWKRLPRCGFSRVYVYDCTRHGAEYVISCLSKRETGAASLYEYRKFGSWGSDVTLSDSVARLVGGPGILKDRGVQFRRAGKKRSSQIGKPSMQWANRSYGKFSYELVDIELSGHNTGGSPGKTQSGLDSTAKR